MSKQITYSYARQNFAEILEHAEDSQEPVIITRRGHEDMAVIPADELRGLAETAHLLRSPKNAQRLLASLQRALSSKGKRQTLKQLRKEFELE